MTATTTTNLMSNPGLHKKNSISICASVCICVNSGFYFVIMMVIETVYFENNGLCHEKNFSITGASLSMDDLGIRMPLYLTRQLNCLNNEIGDFFNKFAQPKLKQFLFVFLFCP